jgi:hypothetical protein
MIVKAQLCKIGQKPEISTHQIDSTAELNIYSTKTGTVRKGGIMSVQMFERLLIDDDKYTVDGLASCPQPA